MIRRQLLIIVTVLLNATASSVHPPDLKELTSAADSVAIVDIGSVVSVGQSQAQIQGITVPVDRFIATARVMRVLKGADTPATIQVRFILPNSNAPVVKYRAVTEGTSRLVFLKQSGGNYDFADPYYPSVPASTTDRSTSEPEPLGNVIMAVAAVVQSSGTSAQEKIEAIIALRTARSPSIIPAFRRSLGLPDAAANTELRGYLLAELVSHGDASVLSVIKGILMNPHPGFPDHIVHNLSYALSKVQDADAGPELATFLSAPKVETRRYAAEGLRNLGAQGIPALVQAVDNTDESVRYSAVIGLADATGQGDWRPSLDEFRSNQEKYLAYWRTWARNAHGARQQ